VDITWSVEGEVDVITLYSNDARLWDGAPLSGDLEDCPSGTGTVTYRIEAVGPGGSTGQQQAINVVQPDVPTATPGPTAEPTPEPTAVPTDPVIDSFVVQPSQIAIGECVDISWSTSGGTTWVTLLRDDTEIEDDAPLSGNLQDCPPDEGEPVYAVIAYNAEDKRVKQEQTITVSGGEPSDPLAGTSWAATFFYNPATNGMEQPLPGTSLTAMFGENTDLSGSGGCNSYDARYQVDGNSLSVKNLSASRSVCEVPVGIMDQEDAYLNNLETADGFSLEAGQLYLTSGGQVIVEFVQR
jgi:heat shock protein HslJ